MDVQHALFNATTAELATVAAQAHHWLTAVPQHRDAVLPTSGITRALGNRVITIKPVGELDRPVLSMPVAPRLWVERTDSWTRLLKAISDDEVRQLAEQLHQVGLAHAKPETSQYRNIVTFVLDRPCLGSLYEAERRYTQGCHDHRDPYTGRGLLSCPPPCTHLDRALALLMLPTGFTVSQPTP